MVPAFELPRWLARLQARWEVAALRDVVNGGTPSGFQVLRLAILPMLPFSSVLLLTNAPDVLTRLSGRAMDSAIAPITFLVLGVPCFIVLIVLRAWNREAMASLGCHSFARHQQVNAVGVYALLAKRTASPDTTP
ncbi:MAG: hypothetical protein WBA67_17455 [Jannaschia sp.]